MQMTIWHIDGSSFHFGRRGLGLEESGLTFPSDSLFAALVARLAVLEGSDAVDAFVRPFKDGHPPFGLTSAYPRADNVLFYPPPAFVEEDDSSLSKKIKKMRFVSEGVFRRLIAGESWNVLWPDLHRAHDDKVVLTGEERESLSLREPFWGVGQRPRVSIDRASSESNIYYAGQTVFQEGCGLWFGVQWLREEEALRSKLQRLFVDLGFAGLGGERSAGFGVCEFAKQNTPLTFDDPDDGYWLNLSRYLPRKNEMHALTAGGNVAYELESVGGWVGTSSAKAQRRRSVNFLKEGSILRSLDGNGLPGQMVDVKPVYEENPNPLPHPVWRNGFSVAVGVQLAASEEVEHDNL